MADAGHGRLQDIGCEWGRGGGTFLPLRSFKNVLWGRPKIVGLCRKECRKILLIVSISVVSRNAVFWDFAPCEFIVNRRFEGTFGLQSLSCRLTLFLARVISTTLKMEATRSSETVFIVTGMKTSNPTLKLLFPNTQEGKADDWLHLQARRN
jgi:hypothetical protein